MSNTTTTHSRSDEILARLSALSAIERGSLKEEYRERPDPDGNGVIRNGPYFKHQCWENGSNKSSRIPADQVELLRHQLEQGHEFDQLVSELATLAIANARAERSTRKSKSITKGSDPGSKKNSAKQASKKGIAKPKPSSRKSPRASAKKDSKP